MKIPLRMKLLTGTALGLACLGVLIFFLLRKPGVEGGFQTTLLKRGDLRVTVSSTGTLVAEDTVEVGSEVSGTIKEIFVDYNDRVHKGQVLARLKTDLLESSLRDAEATLDKSKAEYDEAELNFTRNKALYEKKFLSEKEFVPYKTADESAKAGQKSAQAAVDRAKTNLGYATICSPIDGVILERTIEPGQTLAASFSTPKLFVIAKDLSKMRIKALVDETDISQIRCDQEVSFTVSAFANRIFRGKVIQIRRQPIASSNVINYAVIVSADNDSNLFFPGMTATIEFITDHVHDVFTVPSEALNFHPALGRKGRSPRLPPAANGAMPEGAPPPPDSTGNSGAVWCIDGNKNLKPLHVQVGISDKSNTVIAGDDLREGLLIVTGTAGSAAGGAQKPDNQMPRPPGLF